jgi:hypothetical protein
MALSINKNSHLNNIRALTKLEVKYVGPVNQSNLNALIK